MKVLIISDSHGHVANLKAVMDIAKKSGIKAVIHCGDWDNISSFEAVASYEIPIYTVLGNADVDAELKDALRYETKKFDPNILRFNLGGRKICITHRLTKEVILSQLQNLDIMFSGHYHSKEEKMINFVKVVRPGAIVNGINFAVYDTDSSDVKFVEENG